MTNVALWDAVSRTPTEHTKKITGKQYSGTSPRPQWLVLKATETFGPCGIGWGFSFTERVESGGGDDKLHIAHVRLWYKWNGERGEVEHIGQTMFSGRRKSGDAYTDEDAPKKSVTDALVKALSMVGFAGDIFLGRYDDSKYVAELNDEAKASAKPAPAKPTAPPASQPDSELLTIAKTTARGCTTRAELRMWMANNFKGLRATLGDDDAAELKRFIVDDLAPLLPENDQTELPAKKEAA